MSRRLPLLCLLLLAVPATADAATVSGTVREQADTRVGVFHFRAATGERNDVTVTTDRRGRITFRDARARIQARGDCRALNAHTARCKASESAPRISLGDGDDRAVTRLSGTRVDGGAGNDRLRAVRRFSELDGGRGDDVLTGGVHVDELTGGPGRDRLSGGQGEDVLIDGETDAEAAPDVIDGGPQPLTDGPDAGDRVVYATRTAPIQYAAGGATSLEDTITGIESVEAGAGDDTLTGDDADNQLDGGPGTDVIVGAGGDDLLAGGDGDDHLSSEADAAEDRLDCGVGDDTFRSETADRVARTCETLFAFNNALRATAAPTVDGQTLTFQVGCDPCSGTLEVSTPDSPTPLGRTAFALDAYDLAPVTVTLSAPLPAGAALRVAYASDMAGSQAPGGYTLEP